jgi:Acetyltransferase (GNAT) domain
VPTCTTIRFDAATLSQYVSLFSACFPKSANFNVAYLDWLYNKNPDGPAVGYDAWDGDRLVAHYACVPVKVAVAGQEVWALLSLNTATHPAYKGQGLHPKLATLTYEAGAAAGFHCVFGVANANSTSGFVRKLGFQFVQQLEARIGFGGLGIDWNSVGRNTQFERIWSAKSLAWRCANPKNPVASHTTGGLTQFFARAEGVFLSAYCELPTEGENNVSISGQKPLSPARLFIGLVPAPANRFYRYISIPQRLRPSPLNFLYLPLTQKQMPIEPDSIKLSFLDLDAY